MRYSGLELTGAVKMAKKKRSPMAIELEVEDGQHAHGHGDGHGHGQGGRYESPQARTKVRPGACVWFGWPVCEPLQRGLPTAIRTGRSFVWVLLSGRVGTSMGMGTTQRGTA